MAEAAGGQIQPLVDPEAASAGEVKVDQVFEDYEPETIFMPRIAFSFSLMTRSLPLMFNSKGLHNQIDLNG